jgi:NADH-quinone oxidoreductase subunit L
LLAALAAVLTGTYAFRVVLIAATPTDDEAHPPWGGMAMLLPFSLLSLLAIAGGFGVGALMDFAGGGDREIPLLAVLFGAAAPLLGATLAVLLVRDPGAQRKLSIRLRHVTALRIDTLYYLVLVRGFRRITGLLGTTEGRAPRETPEPDRPPSGVVALVADDPIGRAMFGSRPPDAGPTPEWDESKTAVVRMVAGDPVGRVLLGVAKLFVEQFVARFNPDRIDLAWMRFAQSLGDSWAQARLIQTGRLRDHSLGLALGFAGLLLFAWGTSWR